MRERRPVLMGRVAESRDQHAELLGGAGRRERALEEAVVEAAPARRVPVDQRLARVAVLSREHGRSDRVDDPVTARRDIGVGRFSFGDECQRALPGRPIGDIAEGLLETPAAVVARLGAVLERRCVCGEWPSGGVGVEDVARCGGRSVARDEAQDAERRERENRKERSGHQQPPSHVGPPRVTRRRMPAASADTP